MISKVDYRRKIKRERKLLYFELLGDACVNCGAEDHLQFDHVIRDEKEFDITLNLERSIESILPELQKCQLLCADCHKEKTTTDLKGVHYKPLIHGTLTAYNGWGCRCSLCINASRIYQVDRRKKMNGGN